MVNLVVAVLTLTPDLCVSMILHKEHEQKALQIISHGSPEISARVKLYPVGEAKNAGGVSTNMDLIAKGGQVYASIFANQEWPAPTVFVYDISAFFFVPIKAAVDDKMPGIKPMKLVSFHGQPLGEAIFLMGDVENGSLRWIQSAIDEFDPTLKDPPSDGKDQPIKGFDAELAQRTVPAFKACVAESDRVAKVPGHLPFYIYERWSVDVDWSSPWEIGYLQYLIGLQAFAGAPQLHIGNFPSSLIEPATLDAVNHDSHVFDNGKKKYLEMGWFESAPELDWGSGVKEFLDKHSEKSVVYISFGTVVETGLGLVTLIEYLNESNKPFVLTGGNKLKDMPEAVRDLLKVAEKEGRACVPDWLDQVGVLSHPAILCFVSHCGMSSTMESLLAGVPILAFSRRTDQVMNSAKVYELGIGCELLEHRGGYAIGRPVAHRPGVTIRGTPEAFREEIDQALHAVRGKEGETMRKKANELANEIRRKRKGEWNKNVRELGQLGRD